MSEESGLANDRGMGFKGCIDGEVQAGRLCGINICECEMRNKWTQCFHKRLQYRSWDSTSFNSQVQNKTSCLDKFLVIIYPK